MRFGSQLLAQERHVQEHVSTAVRHHAILQVHNQALLMDVPTVPHNAIMVVRLVQVLVREVVEELVVQRNVSVAVKPIVRHHVVFNVLRAHIVIKQND